VFRSVERESGKPSLVPTPDRNVDTLMVVVHV
jgi:hypothetical protein